MRHLLLPLAGTLGITAVAASAASEEESKAGERHYVTKACHACHGPEGAAPKKDYPALAGQSEKYSVLQMLDIRDGDRVGTIDPSTGHGSARGIGVVVHGLN